MALPAQAQAQVDEVAKLRQQYYPDEGGAQTAADPAPDPANDDGDVAGGEAGDPAVPVDYEHKYKTLQGMYEGLNGESDILRKQLEDANRSIAALQAQQVQQAQVQQAQMQQAQGVPGAVQQPPTPAEPLVTEADSQEYGADLIDLVRRVVREESRNPSGQVDEKLRALELAVGQLQNVAPKVANVERAQAQTAEQMFWSGLSTQVPNWDAINRDVSFKEWLLQPDPLTGQQRQSVLMSAQRALDVSGVAKVFQLWLAESGSSLGGAANQPGVAGNAARGELDAQIAPGISRAVPQPQQQQQVAPVSRDEITKFYDDVRRGLYANKEVERAQFEKRIFDASSAGKITS